MKTLFCEFVLYYMNWGGGGALLPASAPCFLIICIFYHCIKPYFPLQYIRAYFLHMHLEERPRICCFLYIRHKSEETCFWVEEMSKAISFHRILVRVHFWKIFLFESGTNLVECWFHSFLSIQLFSLRGLGLGLALFKVLFSLDFWCLQETPQKSRPSVVHRTNGTRVYSMHI